MTRLAALLADLDVVAWHGPDDVEVTGVTCDSRHVRPGEAFFALPGTVSDGWRYVDDAAMRGAAAIVAGEEIPACGLPVVRVRDPRRALALTAARIAGEPSRGMTLVGVTGTNGKTTTTHLVESMWRAEGRRPGVIGTIEYRHANERRAAPHTTPDAPTMNALLLEMAATATTHVAIEVSSHALAQARVDGLHLDAAALTNVTRDHLDYHGDFDTYVAVKRRLFTEVLAGSAKSDPVAVLNVDDPAGASIAEATPGRVVRVSRRGPADVSVAAVESTLAGSRGTLDIDGKRIGFRTALVGLPHVENVMLAAGIAWGLGAAPETIVEGIATMLPPPGRVEQLPGPGFTVIVDYAHTPDALEGLLRTVRPLTRGALITVFGCGGDRDPGKRPLMGRAAALSDFVVATSDNPRTEDPGGILRDIEPGIRAGGLAPVARPTPGAHGYVVEPDRRTAIRCAVALARPGDVVVVAGKGHEDYQIVGTKRLHLDDREEVRRALEDVGA